MSALAHFPLTPAMQARLSARESAVDLSRTIIRGKERHKLADLRLACETLMTYGDQTDWVEAYLLLRALDAPPPPPVAEAPRRGLIRSGLLDVAGLAAICALALAVYGGGPV